MKRVSVCVLLAAITLSGRDEMAQRNGSEGAPKTASHISNVAMTDEQLAVYRAVLRGSRGHDSADHGSTADAKRPLYLSLETRAYDDEFSENPAGCEHGLKLEENKPGLIHLFRQLDLPKLGQEKIALVDPQKQEQEVADNDPGKAIREGKPVDDAVENGFAHGLVTLGEIRFDLSHTHAILWYGFHCGSLCGNGGTVLLEKREGVWRKKLSCSQWIS